MSSPAPSFAMEFLFKDRGRGKRQVKPKQDLDLLEAQIVAGESDEDDSGEYRLRCAHRRVITTSHSSQSSVGEQVV